MKKKEYIYIVQQRKETSKCKIGITQNLEQRLSQYNRPGTPKDNQFQYLFAAEVKDSRKIENDLKEMYPYLREIKTAEVYFLNSDLFMMYTNFIKSHAGFIEEISCKVKGEAKKIIVYKSDTKTLKERGLTPKDIMQTAQKTQDDEFYTRYEDIEKEINTYDITIWKDKVVFCNCDDPMDDDADERKSSAFTLFFLKNFNKLKLKKLICLHYTGGIDLFGAGGKAYIFTKDGFTVRKDYPKNFSGSFDDPLSIKILNEEADIVCTNPPFSRADDYWKLVIGSGKKFLIISNFTNTITKAFIHYFRDGLVWAGYNRVNWFLTPKLQEVRAPGSWYTNLPRENQYNKSKIVKLKLIPDEYKYFDDEGILCVDRCYIPTDYDKPIAVSVYPLLKGILELGYEIIQNEPYNPYKNGKRQFSRCLIQKKKKR